MQGSVLARCLCGIYQAPVGILPDVYKRQDHKRAFDGDMGPNTGGMGTISPNPFYSAADADWCMEHIFRPTIEAMNQEGRPFKGCLFLSLIHI